MKKICFILYVLVTITNGYAQNSKDLGDSINFSSTFLYNLGVAYEREGNYKMAINYYLQVSQKELPEAKSVLGDFYWDGKSVDRDYKKTFTCYKEAAIAGAINSMQNLAACYLERARMLFEEYPDLKEAYRLCHSLRMIFAKSTIKDAARLNMARWYEKVEKSGFKSFNVIAATFYEHCDNILNFYNNRSSNAMDESFNSKIKLFRANLRGVADTKLFLFRLANVFAYPH